MKYLQNICYVFCLIMAQGVYADTCTDEVECLSMCLIQAQKGDAEAQYHLGWIYRQGKVVSQDYAESVKWYKKAADQGHAQAQTWLGVMYELGWGVEEDKQLAAQWYRKAANDDDTLGQLRLASLYRHGEGVAKNLKEAEKWYLKSAGHQGSYTYARKMIKEMYEEGKRD